MSRKKVVKIHAGDTFGDLTVIEPTIRDSDKSHQYFRCVCSCGNEKIANGTSLLRGDLTSCGCKWKNVMGEYLSKRKSSTALPVGYVSGQVTVLEDLGIIPIGSKKEHCYRCQCDCGKELVLRQYTLKSRKCSCGCTKFENAHKVHSEKSKEKREYPEWLLDVLPKEDERQGVLEKRFPYETKLHFRCSNCGEIIEKPISHIIRLNKHRETPVVLCLNCSNHRSSFEEEVYQYIKFLLPNTNIQRNIWGILKEGKVRYEMDIYIPDRKIAIECNGDYFHSEDNGKPKSYHQHKFQMAEDIGVHLVQIYQSYWLENKDRIKSYLKDMLIPPIRIMARKCTLQSVTKAVAESFYNDNHLQGYSSQCIVNYALLYNDKIVALMSFGKTSFHDPKDKTPDYYELVRYAILSGYTVIGGPSRLLSAFEKEYKPRKILSYSDNDFFLGTMYQKLGFSFEGFSKPRYHWFMRDQTVRARESCQLKYLSKQYPDLYNQVLKQEGNKEDLIMRSLLAVKVWHSGNKRWVKNYKN